MNFKNFTTFKKNKVIEYPLSGANTFTVINYLNIMLNIFEDWRFNQIKWKQI